MPKLAYVSEKVIPDFGSFREVATSSKVSPRGLAIPIPVTTTRR
jgi:hypothetical protein